MGTTSPLCYRSLNPTESPKHVVFVLGSGSFTHIPPVCPAGNVAYHVGVILIIVLVSASHVMYLTSETDTFVYFRVLLCCLAVQKAMPPLPGTVSVDLQIYVGTNVAFRVSNLLLINCQSLSTRTGRVSSVSFFSSSNAVVLCTRLCMWRVFVFRYGLLYSQFRQKWNYIGNKRHLSSCLAYAQCLNHPYQKVCNEKHSMRIHAFHVGPCHMRAEAFGHVRSNRQVFYDEQFTMMSGMPLESSLGNCVSRQHSQKFMHSVGASMSHSAAAPTHCSVWDYPAKSFFSLLVHRNDVIKG